MPLPRPTIDADTVETVAREAFTPTASQQWGLEVEWLVRGRGRGAGRPAAAELAAYTRARLPAGSTVSVEPGGQLEISTVPHLDVDRALDALAVDAEALAALLAPSGLRLDDSAVDLDRAPERILQLPRYAAMEAFLDAAGHAGRWMMCNTSSIQVNLGHHPDEPARRWTLLHTLCPVLIATFANSPGADASGKPWASLRQAIWASLDRTRTSVPPTAADPALAWARYALDAEVMLIRTADTALPLVPGFSFRRWMDGGHGLGWPTEEDLRYHLSTLFPPVRPRGWLELRVLDNLPARVREIAVLTLACAVQPGPAAELEGRLPDTSRWWSAAAQLGLCHPGLAAAADRLFDVVTAAIHDVTGSAERAEAVASYRRDYVDQRRQPWGGRADAPVVATSVPVRSSRARVSAVAVAR